MASKFTYDTNILRIREVFAINPQKQSFIEPYQIPMIYNEGRLKWWSPLEFFSSISVGTTSTTVLDLLNAIQPGLSSLSSAISSVLVSTVNGLGDAGYVSTSYLENKIRLLSYVYHYISATTLYDVVANLGNLSIIGGLPNPMGQIGCNYPVNRGFVSTQYLSTYGYKMSSINWIGENYHQAPFVTGTVLDGPVVPINWFSTQIVSSTQFFIDINTNLVLTPDVGQGTGIQTTVNFSTFFTRAGAYVVPLGEPVVIDIPPGLSSYTIGSMRFPFNHCNIRETGIDGFPDSLQLRFYQTNAADQNLAITSAIPKTSGVFATLNNLM
jgi:hypothetical protein